MNDKEILPDDIFSRRRGAAETYEQQVCLPAWPLSSRLSDIPYDINNDQKQNWLWITYDTINSDE